MRIGYGLRMHGSRGVRPVSGAAIFTKPATLSGLLWQLSFALQILNLIQIKPMHASLDLREQGLSLHATNRGRAYVENACDIRASDHEHEPRASTLTGGEPVRVT